jgi:serine/threonine-protein kinase
MKGDLFQQGERLGEYEIIGKLRSGGMATLYLGRRHGAAGVSKPVAIKVIHPHLAEDELIRHMFIDEARISSHIQHSNVVYVETFGELEGLFFLVMEYVDGVSLDQLLITLQRKGMFLPPEVATHIVLEVADGLHAAHETVGEDGAPLGIVHRDVSPSNILITREGRVKVIDFGIAKARGRLGQTKSGASFKGKLRYMSPEQAWGRELDRRSDVYALGIVLWELLTATPLFKGSDELAILEQVRDPVIDPPSQRAARVSISLDAVVMRATAKDPEHRVASALELRRELQRAVPDAVAVGRDVIAELVPLVRETVGTTEAEDRKQTTPMAPSARKRIASGSSPRASTPPPDTSLGGSVGEMLVTTRRSRAWMILAAAALFAVGAVAVAITVRGGGDRAASPTQTPTPLPSSTPPPSPPPPPPVVAAPPPDAAPTPIATPTPTQKPNPKPKPSVRVDGTMLSDSPDPTKQPKKTKPVEVDGTVLAP